MSEAYYRANAVPTTRTAPRVRYRPTSHQSTTTQQSNQRADQVPTTNSGIQAMGTLTKLANAGVPTSNAFANFLQGTPPIDPGPGPGGGSPRGGGGGGGPVVDQATKDAYLALYNSMKGNTAIDDAWANYEASMRGVYDPNAVGAKYDQAGAQVGAAGQAGRARSQEIYDALVGRAATGRQAIGDAMAQGRTRLQDIQNRFGSMSGGATNQLNDVLGRFGAGGLSNDGYQNEINSQAQAAQLAQGRLGNVFDAAMADRPALYAALQSDVSQGMTQAEQAYMNRLAAQRAAETQATNAQLQQVLGQAGISRAQNTVQQQQEALKLAAQLAEMGIKV